VEVPAAVGTPLSSPASTPPSVVSESPGGKLPVTTVQLLYGGGPPEADRAIEYGIPIVPDGKRSR
jgi:hypothetical protein